MIIKYKKFITEKLEEFYSNDAVHIITDVDENWVISPDEYETDNGIGVYNIYPIEILKEKFIDYIIQPNRLNTLLKSVNMDIICVENFIDQQIDWDAEMLPKKAIDYGKNYNKLMMSKQSQVNYDKDSDDGDYYTVIGMKFKSIRCSSGYQPNGNLNL